MPELINGSGELETSPTGLSILGGSVLQITYQALGQFNLGRGDIGPGNRDPS